MTSIFVGLQVALLSGNCRSHFVGYCPQSILSNKSALTVSYIASSRCGDNNNNNNNIIIIARHHALNDMVARSLSAAAVPNTKEPNGLNRNDGKRPLLFRGKAEDLWFGTSRSPAQRLIPIWRQRLERPVR